jgi:hypothetical protein
MFLETVQTHCTVLMNGPTVYTTAGASVIAQLWTPRQYCFSNHSLKLVVNLVLICGVAISSLSAFEKKSNL